jgi:hypothetical protein
MITSLRNISVFAILFFLSVLAAVGQNVVQIQWKEPALVLDTNSKPVEILDFEGAQPSPDLWPYYSLTLYNVSAQNFTLLDARYEPVSLKEAALLRSRKVPTKINMHLQVENRKPVTVVSFVPLRQTAGGSYEKLVSFSYRYDAVPFSETKGTKIRAAARRGMPGARINAASVSVLSSGVWYKVAVSGTGLHKIDYNTLRTIGINPDFVDPRNIQVYGNGGKMLPQPNNATRYDDLIENAVFVAGESDGKFDRDDYLLFYAWGPNAWEYDTTNNIFVFSKNVYSDKSYYFITVGHAPGLRVQTQPDLGGAAQTFDYFDDRRSHEQDLMNLLHSGREWYGETFDNVLTQAFTFDVTGLIPASTLKLKVAAMGRSVSPTSFTIRTNNVLTGSLNIPANNLTDNDARARETVETYSISATTIGNPSSLSVSLTYNKGSSFASLGHLNYLQLNFRRRLRLYQEQQSFRAINSTDAPTTEYVIANAGGATVWNITNPADVRRQEYVQSGSTISFAAASLSLEEYVVFSGNNFPAPEFVGVVPNQNLHGIDGANLPHLLIVTVPEFLSEANRLAQFRRTNDLLKVLVVTTQQIYNEFSSGSQDVSAIRDFAKMLYDRQTGSDSLRYLLLFGDCSYDYKDRIPGNTNFVPVYQSRVSLHHIRSYSSDDYFGFLDDSEGWWEESETGAKDAPERMDIGVGRIPVRTSVEAAAVVSKLIHYNTSSECLGKWRNVATFVADDGDNNLHLRDANEVSGKLETENNLYNIKKIYLDAYRQIPSPGGEKAPEVYEKIVQEVNNGTFILNYSGHGGETMWAQENILDIPQIESWDNANKLPFMITATCDFGRYDDPQVVSGAEVALFKPYGGVVGVISSTRVVYAHSNRALNLQVYNYIFAPLSDGQMPRLGDVLRQTKNRQEVTSSGVNNRNFALLGDPSLRLSYPKQDILVTKIKGIDVTAQPDTFRALSKVTIQGEIQNTSGTKLTGFSGVLQLTVYDKKTNITTYGTEGDAPYTFSVRNNFLFDGSATITNGDWSVSFVVPKDISYEYDFGKISVYGQRTGSQEDAGGAYANVIIGGTDTNAPADNTPPRVQVYMNDESFVFGGLTGKESLFLAKLSDENGINTAGAGVGHELTLTLDNSEKPIILNSFYTANLNDYTAGSIKYPLKDLAPGQHSLRMKAWDTYNNSAEAYLEFVVANDERIALSHILNYPNPFSTHTVFHFDHNRAGEELDIMIQVYTVSGKLVKTLDTKVYMSNTHFAGLDWDGRDDFGDKIGKGVYVYRVWVRAPRDGSSVHKYEKLVILN